MARALRAAAHAQLQQLALHRPYARGDACLDASSPCALHAPAATSTVRAASAAPVRSAHAGHPAPPLVSRPHDLGAGAAARRRRRASARVECRHHRARVHLAVLRREDRAGDPRREPGLQRARRARREPLGLEPEAALEVVQPAQLLGVVAVGRHHQRAGAPRSPWACRVRSSSSAAKPGHSSRPSRFSAQQLLLAEVRLGHRREHARGHADGARARTRRARRTAPSARPARPATRTPGRRCPRRPRRGRRRFASALLDCSLHCLRRHYPDQVPRSAAAVPPSQPDCPAPVRSQDVPGTLCAGFAG